MVHHQGEQNQTLAPGHKGLETQGCERHGPMSPDSEGCPSHSCGGATDPQERTARQKEAEDRKGKRRQEVSQTHPGIGPSSGFTRVGLPKAVIDRPFSRISTASSHMPDTWGLLLSG